VDRSLEVVQVGDAGLTAAPRAYLLQKLSKETFTLLLWVHVVTLPTKSETATCQNPGQQVSDRVSELFYLIEITVEHKRNTTRIYVHNVYENAIQNQKKKTGKVTWRNGISQI